MGKKRVFAIVSIAAATVLALGIVAVLSGGASAGKGGTLDDGKDLLPLAGITLDEAIAAATSAYRGEVDEVDLEYWQGTLVFNVDVGDRDVKVDAKTGAVLAATRDD